MNDLSDRIVAAPAFEGFAIVELMGHRQRAGFVKEVEMAGAKMLRIDIPCEGGDVTEFYSPTALYALRPCSAEVAKDMASRFGDPRPIKPVEYRERTARPQITDASERDEEEPIF